MGWGWQWGWGGGQGVEGKTVSRRFKFSPFICEESFIQHQTLARESRSPFISTDTLHFCARDIILMNRKGHFTLIRIPFDCQSCFRKMKDELLDIM